MGLSRAARSRLRFRHVDQSHPDDIVTPLQPTLAWPGTDENCPKCHGERQVYYRRASQPGVEVFGGKRVTCPVCAGQGTVRDPLQSFGPAQPSDRR
jgi:hypothetical protein